MNNANLLPAITIQELYLRIYCFVIKQIIYLTNFNESMKRLFLSFILLSISTVVLHMNTVYAQHEKMYVGTYTSGNDSKGVYVYDFDERSGEAILEKTIAMDNPSFLARKGAVLYAVNEDSKGMLTVYDLDSDKILSHVSTDGEHPCHISLSPKDPVLVVSNYSSGSLVLYSLNQDGSIHALDDFLKFNGSSINNERQEESHIHSAFFNREGSQVYVSDLGADLIYVFEIERQNDKYRFHKVQEIKTKFGGGPRHLVFSQDEKTLYSILEMTGEVQVFQKENNDWVSKQIVPMYPTNFKGEHGGGDIKLSKDGKYIFATNRGTANFIYQYKINQDGKLKVKRYSSVFGDSPRNVNLSPSEKFIFVTNQNTNNITIFSKKLEKPKDVGLVLQIPKPVCVIF